MSNLNLKNNNRSKSSGFTIMETLVAIFILLLATTGPMVFTQNSLRSAFLARDQITAFFLAQDAIEYIKNYRDGTAVAILKDSEADAEEWLGSDGSDDSSGSPFQSCFVSGTDNEGCSLDTRVNETVADCATSATLGCVDDADLADYKPLNYYDNAVTGVSYYTLSSGTDIKPSIFAREIKMKTIVPGQEVEITVVIRWKSHEGVGVREIVVKENIFNWSNALNN